MTLDDPVTAFALYQDLLASLRAWHAPEDASSNLLTGLLAVQQAHRLALQADPTLTPREATNQFLESNIAELATRDEAGAAILRARFKEGKPVAEVAQHYHLSIDSVHRRQRKAIYRIVESMAAQEARLLEANTVRLESAMPPAGYARLFGVSGTVNALTDRLLFGKGPWVTAVAGVGGIGKTAVADRSTRQAMRGRTFRHVLWHRLEAQGLGERPVDPQMPFEQLMIALSELPHVGAAGLPEKQRRPLILEALKSEPHLIVVDNIEDEAAAAYLYANLGQFAEPSHFIVTSRVQPTGAPAYTVVLAELAPAHSLALIRHQAGQLNLPELAGAGDPALHRIYDLVGGNPLALKLVVGLARTMSLPAILDELAGSRPGPGRGLYGHIYRRAWLSLSNEAQTVLVAMLLVSETGARPQQIQAISGLDDAGLWPAIRELAACSLLEVRGTLQERRYGIHRLTAAFLRSEIMRRPGSGIS